MSNQKSDNQRGRSLKLIATGYTVDRNDLDELEKWARRLCKGVTVKDAARGLGVEASLDAVTNALTESLPRSKRERISQICRELLLE